MMKWVVVFVCLFAFVPSFSQDPASQTVGFRKIWQQVSHESSALKSANYAYRAAQQAEDRSKMHWLPKVYAGGQAYSTNNPGAVFFGQLQQRAVIAQDFNPQSLNYPGGQSFSQVTLGVDLPIYEGGMKANQRQLQHNLSESKKLQSRHTKNMQYSAVVTSYGSIGVLQQQKKKAFRLFNEIQKLIKTYKVGTKTNPVGYSGLLGLKSLANRIEGLLTQYEQQSLGHYSALREMGWQAQGQWQPEFDDIFVYLGQTLTLNPPEASYFVQSLKANAEMANKASDMELARYRPHVGLFAQGYSFSGNRTSADGYTAGLYLKWNLFSPDNMGQHSEAVLKAKAAQSYALAKSREESAQSQALEKGITALRSNLILLKKSQALLDEQTRVARTLFRNGSINALQLTEVLNRRVDLIAHQTEAQINLLSYSSQKILNQKFTIPATMEGN